MRKRPRCTEEESTPAKEPPIVKPRKILARDKIHAKAMVLKRSPKPSAIKRAAKLSSNIVLTKSIRTEAGKAQCGRSSMCIPAQDRVLPILVAPCPEKWSIHCAAIFGACYIIKGSKILPSSLGHIG